MSGIFKAGQLVTLSGWVADPCNLYNTSTVVGLIPPEYPRAVGRLCPGDVALVIAVYRADAGNVYVVGPHGSGWATGALLTVVNEVP